MNHIPFRADSSQEFATALGWERSSIKNKIIDHGHTELDVSRTYISGENALVIAKVVKRNGVDPFDSAALYGYHVAGEWGVLVDQQAGLTIFNSRWSDEDNWYRLPPVSWKKSKDLKVVLEALTPEGIQSGDLNRLSEKQKKPTGVVMSVDDALVERLDRWRVEALKFSTGGVKLDELLQQVYAQLFVLRTVEDRNLDANVPAVSTALDIKSGEFNQRKWSALISAARKYIGGELFSEDFAKRVPRHVLAGVIRDLYRPRAIPSQDAHYDFSWIDSDVLGAAYEKYLSTVLQPGALLPQSDLFLDEEREVERLTVRKKKGVYYTPKFITNYLAASTIDSHFKQGAQQEPPS